MFKILGTSSQLVVTRSKLVTKSSCLLRACRPSYEFATSHKSLLSADSWAYYEFEDLVTSMLRVTTSWLDIPSFLNMSKMARSQEELIRVLPSYPELFMSFHELCRSSPEVQLGTTRHSTRQSGRLHVALASPNTLGTPE